MNQLLNDQLKQHYDQLNKEHGTLRESLLEHIGTTTGDLVSKPTSRLQRNNKKILSVAASILLGLGVYFCELGVNEQSLYAQVIAAIERVGTMHYSMETHRNGNLYSHRQCWYERGVGFKLSETIGDRQFTTIDDGVHTWSFQHGGKFVSKMKSYRDVNDPRSFNLDKFYFSRLLRVDPQPNPAFDKVVDGETWRCFTATEKNSKLECWIDSRNLIQGGEARQQQDKEVSVTKVKAEYDLNIDRSFFRPQLPPSAEVVDPRTYLGSLYSLDDAIYKQEAVGMVFAVHQLERFNDKWAYMISSTRLTAENRDKLEIDHPWHYFGDSSVENLWDRVNQEPISSPLAIAKAKVGDLIVEWHLLGVRQHDRLESCSLSICTSAANELAKLLGDKESLSTRFEVNLDISADPGKLGLNEFVSAVHSQAERLTPILHHFSVYEVVPNPPKTNGMLQSRDPRRFSEPNFAANVRHRIANWLD